MDALRTQSMVMVPEWHKNQALRLWDVFMLGPVMVYAAGKVRPGWLTAFLLLAGIGTIIYNGANYLDNAKGDANG